MKNDSLIENQSAKELLEAAYSAWRGAAEMRRARSRNKNFTYGKQLDDIVTMPDGRKITEREAILETGKEPLTNNLIRQLVKSVVGRFRDRTKEEVIGENLKDVYSRNSVTELDSRLLEEFLISGCCVQKSELVRTLEGCSAFVGNVDFNRFFMNSVTDALCRDCNIIGELHDMNIAEIIMRLARNNREKAVQIREIYSANCSARTNQFRDAVLGGNNDNCPGFWNAAPGKCRIYEIWTRECREVLKCHDVERGKWYAVPSEKGVEISKRNRERKEKGLAEIVTEWDIMEFWHCTWMAPTGDIIAQYDSPYAHEAHPYTVKLYPLTDGEVHAFVEDVLNQQKYVNRLICLVDHIMNVSAKGVLLYPSDALPTGFTWQQIQRLWSTPNAIIPFDAGRDNMPQQISTNATNIGAYELLSLEMKLFEEISGVSGALSGRVSSSNTGVALYERQTQNAAIALADIYETFDAFRKDRDRKLLSLFPGQRSVD